MTVEVPPSLLVSFMSASSTLSRWCRQYRGTFGVAGSVAAGSAEADSDIDLLAIIAPPRAKNGELPSLPDGFFDSGWRDFWNLYAVGQAHVFGTRSKASTHIHLEVYPFLVARKILRLKQFTVKRIKNGPTLPKRALFYGISGAMREQSILSQNRSDKIFSDLYSVIWDNRELFCGMHLERLLLAVMLVRNERFEALRDGAWHALSTLIAQAVRTGTARENPEDLFFVSNKMSPEVRAEARRRLLPKNGDTPDD